LRFERISDRALSLTMRRAIARYRHRVFVQSLQWQLRAEDGHEQDEFDTAGATHIVAHCGDVAVVGYARLLPTSQPYLLATHFGHLLNGTEPPRTPDVWELSRFAASEGLGVAEQTRVGKQVLLEAVRFAKARGCERLISCTTVSIERLAQRWGIDIRRLGPPQRSAAGLLVAVCIECNDLTLSVLDAEPASAAVQSPVMHMPVAADPLLEASLT
jgi:N-acyl-L-homoserine lactone synthetase